MSRSSAEFSRSAQDLREFLELELAKRNRLHQRSATEWYTEPIHQTIPRNASAVQISASAPALSKTKYLVHGPQKRVNGLSSLDQYAAEYFPTTFSAAYTLISAPKPSVDLIPEPEGLPESPAQPWVSVSTKKRQRPLSCKTVTEVEKLYPLVQEMPVTATSSVALNTPYQLNLAKLRLDRLKIEESHLMEVKRLEELERIRGPRTKWYEIKTPDFHYEARKNRELVKQFHRNDYQALYDYRMRLLKASKQFELQNAFA